MDDDLRSVAHIVDTVNDFLSSAPGFILGVLILGLGLYLAAYWTPTMAAANAIEICGVSLCVAGALGVFILIWKLAVGQYPRPRKR
jgi:hypothetical protein